MSNCTNFIFQTTYDSPHAYRLVEQNFGAKMAASEKFQFHIWFKTIEKNIFYCSRFSFNLTMEHIQLYKFCLRKFHGYKLVEQTLGTEMETNSENFQSQT